MKENPKNLPKTFLSSEWYQQLAGALESGEISREEALTIIENLNTITRNKYYTDVKIGYRALNRITDSKSYKRLPKKAMAWKQTSMESQQTSTRGSHLTKAALLMRQYCEALGLNEKFGEATASGHDVGHSAFAHEGEKILQNILERYGAGTWSHNIQGRKVLNDIEGLDIGWQIVHSIQTHNGEKLIREVKFDPTITEERAHAEYIESGAVKGYERKQVPSTYEGAALVLIDKIAYCAQDLADGFREEIINYERLDSTLLKRIRALGISNETTHELLEKDRSGGALAAEIEKVLISDFIESSRNWPCPRMSKKMSKAMYKLISYNHEHIVSLTCSGRQVEILEKGTEGLMKKYASYLLASGYIDERFPEYSDEERDRNKELGIWNDPEVLEMDTRIVHHNKRCNDNYFEDTRLTVERIAEIAEEKGETPQLTKREMIAMRIAADYLARNTDNTLARRMRGWKCISRDEYRELREKNVTREEITEELSIYHTITGMQEDDIQYICNDLIEFQRYIDNGIRILRAKPEENNKLLVKLEDLSERLGKKSDQLEILQSRYLRTKEFCLKKEIYAEIEDVEDEYILQREQEIISDLEPIYMDDIDKTKQCLKVELAKKAGTFEAMKIIEQKISEIDEIQLAYTQVDETCKKNVVYDEITKKAKEIAKNITDLDEPTHAEKEYEGLEHGDAGER